MRDQSVGPHEADADGATVPLAEPESAGDGSLAGGFVGGGLVGRVVGTPSYEVEGELSSFAATTLTADAGTTNGTGSINGSSNQTTTNRNETITTNGTAANGTDNGSDSSSLLGQFRSGGF